MLISAVRGDVCLAFVNTLSWRGGPAPEESLSGFGDLLDWLARQGGVDPMAVADWRAWSRAHAAPAERLFADALALRETVYRLLACVAASRQIGAADLAALNAALDAAPPRGRLARQPGGFVWAVPDAPRSLPLLLAPVLWSAGDLLAGSRHGRLRQCANDKCLWLFVDESKSGTRRWCDMRSCGNRAKAQRHYRKRMSA